MLPSTVTSAIRAGENAVLRALEAALGQWDEEILLPEVAERTVPALLRPWTPRYASWHVVSTHWAMADMALEHARLARAGDAPPNRRQYNASWWATHKRPLDELRAGLAHPAEARPVAAERFRRVASSLGELAEEDLAAPWDPGSFNDGYLRSLGVHEVTPTVGTLLTLVAVHLQDHAAQIHAKLG